MQLFVVGCVSKRSVFMRTHMGGEVEQRWASRGVTHTHGSSSRTRVRTSSIESKRYSCAILESWKQSTDESAPACLVSPSN